MTGTLTKTRFVGGWVPAVFLPLVAFPGIDVLTRADNWQSMGKDRNVHGPRDDGSAELCGSE